MSLGVRSSQELAAGTLIAVIGAAGLWVGRDWSQGTLAMMQTGFFPRMVSGGLTLLGLVVMGGAFVTHGAPVSAPAWRPLTAVTAAVLAFALAIEPLGLVLALLAVVALANRAGTPLAPLSLAALWAGLTAGCVAIFTWGLDLPLRVWP